MSNEVCNAYYETYFPVMYDRPPSQSYILFCQVLLVLVNVYYLSCAAAYLYYKQKFIRLQMTSSLFKLLAIGSLSVYITIVLLREIIGRDKFACRIYVAFYHLCMFFMVGPILGTLYVYIYKLRLQRERGNRILKLMKGKHKHTMSSNLSVNSTSFLDRSPDPDRNQREATVELGSHVKPSLMNIDDIHENKNICVFIADFLNVMKYSKGGKIVIPSSGNANGNTTANEKEQAIGADGDDQSVAGNSISEASDLDASFFQLSSDARSLSYYTLATSKRLLESLIIPLLIILLFGYPVLILVIYRFATDPLLINGCYGCPISFWDHVARLVSGIVYTFGVGAPIYAMRNEEDPLGLFSELKFMLSASFPFVIAMLFLLIDPGNVNADYVFAWDIVTIAGAVPLVYAITIRHILIAKREYESAIKHNDGSTIRFIGSDRSDKNKMLPDAADLDVFKMLNEPKVRNALLEHSINELSSENVVFAIKVKTWKSIYEKESYEKVTRIAVNIFNEFISRDSKSAINIPNNIFQKVEKEILPYLQENLGIQAKLSNAGKKPSTDQVQVSLSSLSSSSASRKPRKEIFDLCEKECLMIIETDTLPRFIKSSLFKERVIDSDLLRKIYA